MKKVLLSLIGLISFSVVIFAQCDDLFISEYVNGFGNNRAIELYNPTPDPIPLDDYAVGRYRNGASAVWFGVKIGTEATGQVVQPYSTFVIASNKTMANTDFDPFEHQIWNGYVSFVPKLDELTNEPELDAEGNVIMVVLSDVVAGQNFPIFGDVYNELYDLQGKADTLVCPVYETNRAFYFNGNDATVLTKGSNPPETYDPDNQVGELFDGELIDVVGVIGEDPEDVFGTGGWFDENGTWITLGRTLVRRPEDKQGEIYKSDDGDSFFSDAWIVYPENTFSNLGWHASECDPNFIAGIADQSVKTNVYPNPVTDGKLNVQSEKHISKLFVYDMSGRKMRGFKMRDVTRQLNLDLGDLLPGIYSLHLVFEDGTHGVNKLSIR